jgi:hypothetical protein
MLFEYVNHFNPASIGPGLLCQCFDNRLFYNELSIIILGIEANCYQRLLRPIALFKCSFRRYGISVLSAKRILYWIKDG